jgi:RNA-binding protein 25
MLIVVHFCFRPLLSVFGGDEEEDKPKRKLIPLTYTEEEKRAMQETQASTKSLICCSLAGHILVVNQCLHSVSCQCEFPVLDLQDKHQGTLKNAVCVVQAVASPEKPADNKATLKKSTKNVPTDKDGVFSYPIKWEAYDKYSFSMAPKLSQWVLKKTAELLGEEELSMVEYVMSMLKEHVPVRMLLSMLHLYCVLTYIPPAFWVLFSVFNLCLSTAALLRGFLTSTCVECCSL